MFDSAMNWYFRQSFGADGPYFWIFLVLAVAAAMVVGFPRGSTFRKRRLIAPLVVLPAIWLIVCAVGILFERAHSGPLTPFEFLLAPGLSLLVAGVFVWRLKGARLFTIAYAVINIQLTIVSSFLMAMAVTGAWM